jgi:hypothetical protein
MTDSQNENCWTLATAIDKDSPECYPELIARGVTYL